MKIDVVHLFLGSEVNARDYFVIVLDVEKLLKIMLDAFGKEDSV